MREDIQYKEYAESLGFTAKTKTSRVRKEGVPSDPYFFEQGNVRVWSIRYGWQVASIIDGRHTNHFPKETLLDALETAHDRLPLDYSVLYEDVGGLVQTISRDGEMVKMTKVEAEWKRNNLEKCVKAAGAPKSIKRIWVEKIAQTP